MGLRRLESILVLVVGLGTVRWALEWGDELACAVGFVGL